MSDSSERAVVEKLYACFAAHDGPGMAACYAPDATFSDPVFVGLSGPEVGGMWRMLTAGAADLVLERGTIERGEQPGEYLVPWTARYTFSGTGNKVVNHVTSRLRVVDDKIRTQVDAFDLPAWQAQALGAFGSYLGWTGLPTMLLRSGARKKLTAFLAKHP